VDFRHMELVTRSQSSEWWRALAIAVIFGLAFATVLTLVVVPALYVWLGGFVRAPAGKGASGEPEA
jgi:multidrug efflux pump